LNIAKVLKQNGFDAVVYEKLSSVGGVWTSCYRDINIQSYDFQYHYSDFPWPNSCDSHPTAGQVLDYLNLAVAHFELEVHLEHKVESMEEKADGWLLCISSSIGSVVRHFDYVIVSSGIFTDGKYRPVFPNQDLFRGEVLTEREINDVEQFTDKRVLIMGYGKAALDMTVLSAPRSRATIHLFREPRWTLPEKLFGVPFSYFLFSRVGTSMISSWSQPSAWATFLHKLQVVIYFYWNVMGWLFRLQSMLHARGKGQVAADLLRATHPTLPLMQDRRFVVATMPEAYYPSIVSGRIVPIHSQIQNFYADGVVLVNGVKVDCDLVVLSLGNQTPGFPFLPEKQRWLMEREGGAQLYRHLIHPRIPRLGFVGLNHCFLHIPAVEIGTLWIIASWRGELELPSVEVSSQPAHLVLAVPTMIMYAAFGVLCVLCVCCVWSGHGAECEESDGVEERKHRIRTHPVLSHIDPISTISGHVVTGLGTESLPQNAQYICGNVL
jgi:dimethylaniline monooxygenase (N-oxide forming)